MYIYNIVKKTHAIKYILINWFYFKQVQRFGLFYLQQLNSSSKICKVLFQSISEYFNLFNFYSKDIQTLFELQIFSSKTWLFKFPQILKI